jgi:hypothetical protein
MVFVLALLASSIVALGNMGSVGVDIIGSRSDDLKILAPGASSIDLEIIGSVAKNTTISSQSRCHETYCSCWAGYTYCYPWTSYIPSRYWVNGREQPWQRCHPCDGMHF